MIPNFIPPFVRARSIAQAWPQALRLIVANGRTVGEVVDQRGDRTYEVEGLHIVLSDPLNDMIPDLPSVPGVTAWGCKAQLDSYFHVEILGRSELGKPLSRPEGFDYVYADAIRGNIEAPILTTLRKNPATRRAIIQIGDSLSPVYANPPCLRSVQFLIRGGWLNMITTWRSRDVAGAWATNAYGLIRLQEYVAKRLGLPVGTYTDFSTSAHIRIGKEGNPNDKGDLWWVKKVIA